MPKCIVAINATYIFALCMSLNQHLNQSETKIVSRVNCGRHLTVRIITRKIHTYELRKLFKLHHHYNQQNCQNSRENLPEQKFSNPNLESNQPDKLSHENTEHNTDLQLKQCVEQHLGCISGRHERRCWGVCVWLACMCQQALLSDSQTLFLSFPVSNGRPVTKNQIR